MNLASTFRRPRKFRVLLITSLLAVLPALLFAKTYQLTPSSIDPGARGEVSTARDKNGNTMIGVKVEHLAKPSSLTPRMSYYVVWIQQHGAAPVNQGVLKVDDKLEGEFESSTPSKIFDLRITAEHDPTVESPSGPEVLRAVEVAQ